MNTSDKLNNYRRAVVYTAIFGDIRDRLRSLPSQRNNEVAFFAFLENTGIIDPGTVAPIKWETADAIFHDNNPRRQARAHKILSHKLFKTAGYTLWIDGSIQIVHDNVLNIMEEYLENADLCVFKHRTRQCIYEEVFACIEQRKDDKGTMIDQVARYLKHDYPRNNGLAETTVLLRRNCMRISKFNEMWWSELENGSYRDQLSFDYVAWKMGIKYNTFPGTIENNPYFKWIKH